MLWGMFINNYGVYPINRGLYLSYEGGRLAGYQTVTEARLSLVWYFSFYNHEGLYQTLGYHTPAEKYGAKRRSLKTLVDYE